MLNCLKHPILTFERKALLLLVFKHKKPLFDSGFFEDLRISGGSGEIRTLEGLAPLPVFKTGAFNRSATLPFCGGYYIQTKSKCKCFFIKF